MPSLTRLVSLLSTLALLAFSQVFAQSDADVHITPRTSMERPIHRSSDAPAPPDSEPVLSTRIKPLRVDVDLVLVPVTVTNPANQPVLNLDKPNFELFENNQRQQLQFFSVEDAPISIGLLLDVSRSMRSKIETERAALREFFNNANPEDDYFAISFSNRPKILANATQSIGTIEAKLGEVTPDGNTALLDAVSLGVAKLHNSRYKRKALLIISDGGDNNSRYRLRDIKSLVQESDVMVYAIGIFDDLNLPLLKSFEEKMGKKWLDEMTDASGGRTVIVDNLARVPEAAASISRELRSQYVLGYKPSNTVHDGSWRRIKVRVTPATNEAKLQASYKRGYSAPGR
jgi:Ca-activated chloride channel family protein